jgi:triacylglycerol esterase/lipase EstA (alpha/beta hydrolase family)
MVFVHGYQGNSFDMRLWKNILAVKYPDHILLSMTSNEDNTEQDIMFMGQKLSEEVKKWIKEWCPKDQFAKLSFVGHSLGGLIIRAALPHLDKYRDKMHTILTLATPHLGYMLSSSKVVDTGT